MFSRLAEKIRESFSSGEKKIGEGPHVRDNERDAVYEGIKRDLAKLKPEERFENRMKKKELNRKMFLEGNGDIGWLKKLRQEGKTIPVRRSDDKGWSDARIANIDDDYNAVVTFGVDGGKTGRYNLPTEVLIAMMKESGEYNKKISDMYPGVEEQARPELQSQELQALRDGGVMDYFLNLQKQHETFFMRLPEQDNKRAWFKCSIESVDSENGKMTVLHHSLSEDENRVGKKNVQMMQRNTVNIADAYTSKCEYDWRGPT